MEVNKNRFNKGTTYGRKLIKKSLQKLGCGRSVLADRDGVIINGHDVVEIAKELGFKIKEIETTGDELIVVKRMDLSQADTITHELEFVDNLSSEKNLDWDSDALLEYMDNDLAFDPRRWNGHSCIVKQLKLEDLFTYEAPKRHVVEEKDEKECEDEFEDLNQLSLF